MQGHFSFGFTITNGQLTQQQRRQAYKQESNPKQEIREEQSSENMLFMIGNKQIGQRHHQVIDIESQSSNDSDKTINLKKQHKRHKKEKHKKHKKKRKHKQEEKHSKTHHQTQKQKIHFDIQQQESQQSQDRKNHKKQKKIKKHKDKNKQRKRSNQQNNNQALYKIVNQSISSDKKQKNALEFKLDNKQFQKNKLFPSLLDEKTFFQQQQKSLVPLPSFLNQADKSKHLYTSYLQKLESSSLLPSRTLKEMSSSIVNKNEEFGFLYKNDNQRFEKQLYLDFFTNGKFPDYLKSELMFDIIRFPTKQLYTYSKHMDKDIPKYQLIQNYNKVIGVKTKKQHKYEKIMKEIYRSLNQQDFSYNLKDTRDKGNDDRYFHYEGYEKLQGIDNLVEKRQKLRMRKLKLKQGKSQQRNVLFDQQCLFFIPFEDRAKQFSAERQLQILQLHTEQEFIQQSRLLNVSLTKTPNDIQLWLKLVNLQDTLSSLKQYSFSNQSFTNNFSTVATEKNMRMSGFIMEKKLAILWRGLKVNQYNEQLGIKYFTLLFSYLQQSQKKDLTLITEFSSIQALSSQLLRFVNKHSANCTFWLLYVNLKLLIEPAINLSATFTHTYVKHILTQITFMINKLIQKQKSAFLIKQYRKISLLILQTILSYYHQQGYTQLTLGIGVALIEFNLFVPKRVYEQYSRHEDLEKKKKEFQLYWEDYKQERVGDLLWRDKISWDIWDQKNQTTKMQGVPIKKKQQKSYIDTIVSVKDYQPSNELDSVIKKQQMSFYQNWHPANPLYNKSRIKQSIESLVLYEDIDRWLLNYRDSQNILRLINVVVVNGISLRGVFNVQGEQQVIGGKESHKRDTIFERQLLKRCIDAIDQKQKVPQAHIPIFSQLIDQLFVKSYWPIQFTQQLLLRKIIYLSRLLRVLSPKLIPVLFQQKEYKRIYELHEYRMFLLGVMYVHDSTIINFRDIIQNDENILQEMKEILGWQSQFLTIEICRDWHYDGTKLWAMYIEFQWLKNEGLIDCAQCYQRLILMRTKSIREHYQQSSQSNTSIENYYYLSILEVCRYYMMFLKELNTRAATLDDQWTESLCNHVLTLLAIIFSHQFAEQQSINPDKQQIIAKQIGECFSQFNQCILVNTSSSVHQAQRSTLLFILNPIKKLQYTNIVQQLIKTIMAYMLTGSNQRQDLNFSKVSLKWLSQLITIDDQEIQSVQSSSNNMGYKKQQQRYYDKFHTLSCLLNRRLQHLQHKHQQLLLSLHNHPSTSDINFPHLAITLNSTIHLYKQWRYLLLRYDHPSVMQHNDNVILIEEKIMQMIEIKLLKNTRLLESTYEQIQHQITPVKNDAKVVGSNELNRNDCVVIFNAKLKQLYSKLFNILKTLFFNQHFLQSSHTIQILLQLMIKIFEQSSLFFDLSSFQLLKLRLLQLKQIIYPLIVKYPQQKMLHLQYLQLLAWIISLTHQQQQRSSTGQRVILNKQVNKYHNEIQQLINQMKVHGIRLTYLKSLSETDQN